MSQTTTKPNNQQPVATETTNDCQWAALNNGHDYCDHAAPVRHYRESNTQPPAPVGTPTPWRIGRDFRIEGPPLGGNDYGSRRIIADMSHDDRGEREANARLIIQAVNTYTTNQQRIAELEAALREIKTTILRSSTLGFGVESVRLRSIIDAVLNRGGER